MMKANEIFGLINIASALLMIGISIPLAKGLIKMNDVYGIRIKKAFESEDNWYKINAYGGKQLIIWAIPMFLVGVICFFVPIHDQNKDLMSFLLGVLPITLCIVPPVIKILAFARKMNSDRC